MTTAKVCGVLTWRCGQAASRSCAWQCLVGRFEIVSMCRNRKRWLKVAQQRRWHRTPAPSSGDRSWPWPRTWPPSGRRTRPTDRPLWSPCRRRRRRRGRPSRRMCRRWSSVRSSRRRPAQPHTKCTAISLIVAWKWRNAEKSNEMMRTHHWTADDKQSARIDVHNRVGVEILFRNNCFDHFVHNLGAQCFQCDFLRMLEWDDDGVNTFRYACAFVEQVLAGDLNCVVGGGGGWRRTAAQFN